MNKKYINREISWLAFNARVLQEAQNKTVPLFERLKFLGIFSSNLDEFFRVRVASLKRLVALGRTPKILGEDPKKILSDVMKVVVKQQQSFEVTYQNLIKELAAENILIIDETQLNPDQAEFLRHYFHQEVRPTLQAIMIKQTSRFPNLKDHAIYLAAILKKKKKQNELNYALIEVSSDVLPRFVLLPSRPGKNYLILLDDIVRFCLKDIFGIYGFQYFEAYTIKVTRDAEIEFEFDEDDSESYLEILEESLKKRKKGRPVRFVYDSQMPDNLLRSLQRRLRLKKADNLIPAGRYHNFKDFINFPGLNRPDLHYPQLLALPHPYLKVDQPVLKVISQKDILLHFPYQSFHYILDLLREASIDPNVTSIKMTLYRVAKNSNVIKALTNAAKNGKKVVVIVELQARFDEEANIFWAKQLEEEGVKVYYGVPYHKVHSKLCLISSWHKGKLKSFVAIGTGNFNESTSRVYADEILLTHNTKITREVARLFSFLENPQIDTWPKFRNLLVSPQQMKHELLRLIDGQIYLAKKKKPAHIWLKMNNLNDPIMIEKLYEASGAGVKIKIILRSVCCLLPQEPQLSKNIEIISIVDRFLEHARIMVFGSGPQEKVYISSADWMTRNLDHRVEVACPIWDPDLKRVIRKMLHFQWNDNQKARIISQRLMNRFRRQEVKKPKRAQMDFYQYLQSKVKKWQNSIDAEELS